MNKLFIIGLPRTATTSVSVALLELGFKVAHTAYTIKTFELADVISDTPCFCDYKELDMQFPGSKFLYLDRDMRSWVPSIQMLLEKYIRFIEKKPGKLNPLVSRCFSEVFYLDQDVDHMSEEFLVRCYHKHQEAVFEYFSGRNDFISLNISDEKSYQMLVDFLEIDAQDEGEFPLLNTGRMINGWKDVNHPNKINSNSVGENRRQYFNFKNKNNK